MIREFVREHARIERAKLGKKLLRRLQQFDLSCAATTGKTIFDWSDIDTIRAKNYVGIIQLPGLSIEILPKITEISENYIGTPQSAQERELAQKNLMYMLCVAGLIPFEERQLADQRVHKLPMADVLVAAFSRALVRELRRGVPHDYVQREENLLYLRGKILHGPNSRLNAVHKERLFAQYEDFISDTPLNRILLATCERLQQLSLGMRTQAALADAALMLADVERVQVNLESFKRIHLNRNTERFAAILEFCRIVLLGQSPVPGSGRSEIFSLLFPMEQVFEGFVGGILRRHARELGLTPSQVRLQSAGRTRCLVRTPEGRGRFLLRPDVLIENAELGTRCVLDTKWKRPKSDAQDRKNGILSADMYQLYAYAHRFNSPDNVLLYPAVGGATPKKYHLYETEHSGRLRIEFLNVTRDLYAMRTELIEDLRAILPAVMPQKP